MSHPAATAPAALDAYDAAIGAFSRLRQLNSGLLETVAARWSVASSDIRAIYFLSQHDEATPKRIAEHLGITTGAMTSMVDRIERAGLVHRSAHPSDRRSITIGLTERGLTAVQDALGHYRRAFAAVIPAEGVDTAAELFTQLGDAFDTETAAADSAASPA